MSTYLPTLTFYFSLLLTPNPSPDLLARVMARLTTLRSALATMEELELTAGDIDDSDSSDEDDDDGKMLASQAFDMDQDADQFEGFDEEEDEYNSEDEEVTDSMLAGLADEELEELMKDMAGDSDADALIARVKQVQRAKLGLPPLEEEEEEVVEVVKKKRGGKSKAEKRIARRDAAAAQGVSAPRNPLNLGPLLPPIASTRKNSSAAASTSRSNNEEDDFLDPISLSHTDLNDKAARKHTLRFHVSQVHQKSVKRESGGKQRIGGDDDLPRKSKEASRREVLKRQEHGGKGKTGEALDGMDWDEEDKREAVGASGGGDEGEDYYDLVKRETREGKVAKQVEYDDARGAEKFVVRSSFLLQPLTLYPQSRTGRDDQRRRCRTTRSDEKDHGQQRIAAETSQGEPKSSSQETSQLRKGRQEGRFDEVRLQRRDGDARTWRISGRKVGYWIQGRQIRSSGWELIACCNVYVQLFISSSFVLVRIDSRHSVFRASSEMAVQRV